MKERGRIREIRDHWITVEITEHNTSSCNQCSLHGQCHRENGERTLIVWNNQPWKKGEEVLVEIRESLLIEIATLVFFVPTILLIGGSALLSQWMPISWGTLITIVGVTTYFCLLRCFTPRIMRRFRLLPITSVTEVYDEASNYTRYPKNIGL